jgi:hypothetical protein
MSSFDGRLRLPGQAKLPLAVEIDVSRERIKVTAGDETVVDWSLDSLEIEARPDGFHFTVDDEQVVLSVTEATKFAKELNLPATPPRRPPAKTARKPTADSVPGADPDGDEDGLGKHAATATTAGVAEDDPIAALRRRVDDVAAALATNTLTPAEAFAQWLGLLKEINQEHGGGSMPSDVFYELNSRLLDMIPAAEATDT